MRKKTPGSIHSVIQVSYLDEVLFVRSLTLKHDCSLVGSFNPSSNTLNFFTNQTSSPNFVVNKKIWKTTATLCRIVPFSLWFSPKKTCYAHCMLLNFLCGTWKPPNENIGENDLIQGLSSRQTLGFTNI